MKYVKRIIVYVVGILILALGTVLFTRSHLGVSAIVSVPFTLSLVTPITLGMCTTIVYSSFVIIALILYREVKLKVLLQLPFSFIFGLVIDMYNNILTIDPQSIITRIFCLAFAVIATAVGISMMVKADFIVNPPDGIVQAISKVTGKEFGTAKWIWDLAMVIFAGVVGFMAEGRIVGIGIGTIVAVFTIGNLIKLINIHIMDKVNLQYRVNKVS